MSKGSFSFRGVKFDNGGLQSSGTPSYSRFIAISRYSKWLEFLNGQRRREEWDETVHRYINHMSDYYSDKGLEEKIQELYPMIYNLHSMPSMRGLAAAGPALNRDHVPLYNCAFTGVETLEDFDEIMYVLMCGTGVGFSVEHVFIDKLPSLTLKEKPKMGFILKGEDSVFVSGAEDYIIDDSKEGWSGALRALIASYFEGHSYNFVFDEIRPEGAPLKTFGGRSSGPVPLFKLFRFIDDLFAKVYSEGRDRLTSEEIADIVCMIASIVVVGGVRRSALLCLTDLDDKDMAVFKSAKDGVPWFEHSPWRGLANISASYNEPVGISTFMDEWSNLYNSYSGERGIFSRYGAINKLKQQGKRETDHVFGVNPCGEQILRPRQFCNLSEVVVRPTDGLAELKAKVYASTALGTLQSGMCEFEYLRPEWKFNTEDERLLGVSLTGVYEHPILGSTTDEEGSRWRKELREVAHKANEEWASAIGIRVSVGVTTMKPSGTVSQLVNASPGVNRRPVYSDHYIRGVRADRKDPLARLMKDMGYPYEEILDAKGEVTSFFFKFPMINPAPSAPSSVKDFELWTLYNREWSDHAVSTTINYTDSDFMELGQQVYNRLGEITGVAFLPFDGHVYTHAPYTPCSKEEYDELLAQMPVSEISSEELAKYETEDNTTAAQTLACAGGACEVVDL